MSVPAPTGGGRLDEDGVLFIGMYEGCVVEAGAAGALGGCVANGDTDCRGFVGVVLDGGTPEKELDFFAGDASGTVDAVEGGCEFVVVDVVKVCTTVGIKGGWRGKLLVWAVVVGVRGAEEDAEGVVSLGAADGGLGGKLLPLTAARGAVLAGFGGGALEGGALAWIGATDFGRLLGSRGGCAVDVVSGGCCC